MIFRPSAFRGDPYGFVTNQAGHAYLVGFPLAWFWAHVIGSPVVMLIMIAAVYMLLWEVMAQQSDEWADSAEDTLHTVLGASVALTMWGHTEWGLWPYGLQAFGLIMGAALRKFGGGR